MQESVDIQALARRLNEAFEQAGSNVVVWHDEASIYETQAERIAQHADAVLLCDTGVQQFELLHRVYSNDCGNGNGERVVLYRCGSPRTLSQDWLSDVELWAEHFAVDAPLVATGTPASDQHVQAQRSQDTEKPSNPSPIASPDKAYPNPLAFSDMLEQPFIREENLPEGIHQNSSFRHKLKALAREGRLLDYGDGLMISERGLAELGIVARDVQSFPTEAIEAARNAGYDRFTLTTLRQIRDMPELLAFDLPDTFYHAALLAQPQLINSAKIGKAVVFAPVGLSPRGKDLIQEIVERQGSMYMNNLLEVLYTSYGIELTAQRVQMLIGNTDLYLYRSINRIYPSYDQFIEEVD